MALLIDADYSQAFLLPPSLEDWIEPTHPARFIREFVEALNLEEVEIVWASGEKGRPAYSAQLLLKLWLYGYFERIRSSRKLERACRDHIGFVWLAGMHRPDHNTLNNFFRSNKKGIRNLFKKTVRVAVEADMVGFVLHAVDGTKIAARVANRGGWHKKKLLALLEKLDSRITELEKQLEETSVCDTPDDALPKELGERQALRKKVRSALQRLQETDKEHLHPSDEDACVMPCKEQNRNAFAYNGQAVADETCGILVACEATTDCNDEQQLNAMLDKVQEQAGQSAERTLADTGYATGRQFEQAEKEERDVVVALPQSMRPNPQKPYAASNFIYDAERDILICPHDSELRFQGTRYRKERGYHLRRYHCTNTSCPHRAQCTKKKTGRTVDLNQYNAVIKRQRDKQTDPIVQADLKKRGYLIEPVFAFIKQHLGFRRFTVCGLDNIQAQWAMVCATYNLHKIFKLWKSGKINTLPPYNTSESGVFIALTESKESQPGTFAPSWDFFRTLLPNQRPTAPRPRKLAA